MTKVSLNLETEMNHQEHRVEAEENKGWMNIPKEFWAVTWKMTAHCPIYLLYIPLSVNSVVNSHFPI